MRHAPRILWLVALGLCLLSVQLAADEPRPAKVPLAQVSITPTRVEWLPLADHKPLVLTVAGPEDFYLQRELRAGETPSFSSLDFQDNRLPDGVYAYELRAAGEPTQLGHLWVQKGRFVDKIPADLRPPIRNITALEEVIPDNLVVEGRACFGSDCVPGDGDNATAPLSIREFANHRIVFEGNLGYPSEHPWALQAGDINGPNGDFTIRDLAFLGTIPFRVGAYAPDNALTIAGYNGNLGLGTLTPAQRFHLFGTNGTTQALIEETNATTALRTLVQLKNNGDIRLNYTNTATGVTWGNNIIGGNYKILKAGAGVTAVDVQGNGNVTIAGILIQNSDRDTKHDIVPVQPDEILGKVLNLPIATWVRNGDDARHLGPMAQDFATAFGLGEDERHIATLDMAGVSLASIQALNNKVTTALAAKDTEIETLRRENSDLAQRLATLEKLVSSLKEEAKPESEPAP